MKKVMIFGDSTCDVEKKYFEEYDFDYVYHTFHFEGEESKEYMADLDWKEVNQADYYGRMRGGKRSVTSMITQGDVEAKWTAALEKGLDIVYIACSSKLSGSLNFGKQIAEELLPKYPGRKIYCVDSLRSNYAQGSMCMKAAEMALNGAEAEEIVKYVEENRLKYQTYCTVGSLTYLQRAGRVKAGKAFFGNLFGVKPLIMGDAIGNNYAFSKAKGRKNSLDALVQLTVDNLEDPKNQVVYVEHADCEEDAKYVADQIIAKLAPKKVNLSNLGPIIGATVGPDSITVNFYGKEVTIKGEE